MIPPIDLPDLWPHQKEFVDDPARFTVCKSATKCGKTTAAAWWIADAAMRHDGGLFWWIGPTNDVGLIGYKTALHLVEPIVVKKQERPWRFWLENGSCVALRTAQEPQHLMGSGVHGAVLDEAGLPEYDKAFPNILTTLSATKGRAKIIGNPGDAGHFMDQAEKRGLNPDWPDWSFRRWKYLDRPTATQQELDEYGEILGVDSVEFRRYYLGETIKGHGAFFHNLDAVFTGRPEEPKPGAAYLLGVDCCISSDYFVASVWNIKERRQVYYSRYKGPPTEQQEEEIDRVSLLYNNAPVVIEENGPGGPIARNLMIRGRTVYPFNTSATSKPKILYEYRSDLAHGTLTLLDDDYQKSEHMIYQQRIISLTNVKFGAPHGAHDDMVMANAIANNGLRRAVDVQVLWA